MNGIKRICVNVSTIDGINMHCESHIVSFGPGGLLIIPEKLGYAADNLLCFPSEEEREDIANQGASFNAVCDTIVIGRVPSIRGMLLSAGFLISEDPVAVVSIRCDPASKLPLNNSTASLDLPTLPTRRGPVISYLPWFARE